ncbi:MAG: rhodanese-like domain-containing protein [Pigmentiphaga sp.]|uniref:rhodanese-like domain-containing protein n=1 Tax=Pigmentiphaga sp. TaxID=1977564 RepID=UPI0029AEF7EE|nr:rhodanese-like domain-containing protein [Pigmentiphaga sp.]MDX3907116.1 rhodanese-like domain-containing protein [Pigmentiphaga sp.]
MKFIVDNILLIALAFVSGGMLLWQSLRSGPAGGAITPAEATAAVNQRHAVFVDVRPTADFAAGHIAQSRSVPLAELKQKAAGLPKNKPLILVGANGRDAAKAVAEFKAHGFAEVNTLAGGLAGWVQAGMPIAKG